MSSTIQKIKAPPTSRSASRHCLLYYIAHLSFHLVANTVQRGKENKKTQMQVNCEVIYVMTSVSTVLYCTSTVLCSENTSLLRFNDLHRVLTYQPYYIHLPSRPSISMVPQGGVDY
jgi:hypothetical protein